MRLPCGLGERQVRGLNFMGLKIDTGWIRYGCYENPARRADNGCPENVLYRVKHNPESSWEFHCCLGFRNCLFLFLGSNLSFLPLSPLVSLLPSLFLLLAVRVRCIHVEHHCLKSQLALTSLVSCRWHNFKNLKWTPKELIISPSAFESFTLLIKDPGIK